jgi:hypothetical protein
MANVIKIKRSAVQGKVPLTTDLDLGELAINTYDGKLYTKKNDGTDSVVLLSSLPTDLSYTSGTRLLESSTGADVTLPLVSSSFAGLAPASGGGTTNFLRADGVWAAPAGGGGGGSTVDPVIAGMIF